MASTEKLFTVNGYNLVANEWHKNGDHKVIALHGWLDNAASFDLLAPLLPNCHIIALDAPGHGYSDHKPIQATYNIWDDLLDILAVADAMQWDNFVLLGHSRGAIISLILAAAAPERISRLLLLDGIWAPVVKITDTVSQFKKFIVSNRASVDKTPALYHSLEQAVAIRCKATSMSTDSARLIVERGLKVVEGGYQWRTDPRLLTASAVKMTAEHNRVLMEAVKAPILLLLAQEGVGANPVLLDALDQYAVVQYHILPGQHHFHMDSGAIAIARYILDFISGISGTD